MKLSRIKCVRNNLNHNKCPWNKERSLLYLFFHCFFSKNQITFRRVAWGSLFSGFTNLKFVAALHIELNVLYCCFACMSRICEKNSFVELTV